MPARGELVEQRPLELLELEAVDRVEPRRRARRARRVAAAVLLADAVGLVAPSSTASYTGRREPRYRHAAWRIPSARPAPAQRRHLAGGAALSVIADVGPLVAAGVLSIVLARVIGPSGNGEFALLITLASFAVLVFSLGPQHRAHLRGQPRALVGARAPS